MDINEYFEEMKDIQKNLLDFLDSEIEVEEKYQNLTNIFSDLKAYDNRYKIKSIMHLLIQISKNRHHGEDFFSKIERILTLFKDEIQKFFSNSELFNIFKSSKRILLFLIEAKIVNFDESIAKRIIKDKYIEYKYPQYFQPEIQRFLKEEWFPKYNKNEEKPKEWILEIQNEIPPNFYVNRKIGENEEIVCKLIRKDMIKEFIAYVKTINYPLKKIISQSNYETNNFLINKKNMTLIRYAAFFGSIRIFKYLMLNKIKLKPLLWLYAIHSNHTEILRILEENHVELPEKINYKRLFKESIKCHHINISNYILYNYLINTKEEYSDYSIINCLKYYNFVFIQNDKINETSFNYLCKYDYYTPVLILLITKDIDINKEII